MAAMYDNIKHVNDTFLSENVSQELLAAQEAEYSELRKAIIEISKRLSRKLRVLDIGVGNARVLRKLHADSIIWNSIENYTGIDAAQNCVDLSNRVISELKIKQNASAQLLDSQELHKLNQQYDLVITTWFTAGNFYPDDFIFENYISGTYDLSTNPKFSKIFRAAFELLEVGGEIVIGSAYIDNEETRLIQESAYLNFGWEIITSEKDSFVATSDGWWSQRFTIKQVRQYLEALRGKDLSFIPLDDSDFAMMIRIKKLR
ncbi:MAG: methyltransferase domain-containing protein [Pyrinomonadaceae bacterium]